MARQSKACRASPSTARLLTCHRLTFPSFTFCRNLNHYSIVGVTIMVLQEVEAHRRASGGSFDSAPELCRASTSTAWLVALASSCPGMAALPAPPQCFGSASTTLQAVCGPVC